MKLGSAISSGLIFSAPNQRTHLYAFDLEKLLNQPTVGATQVTEINTLDQITEKVIDVMTHIPLEAFMMPLKHVRGVVTVSKPGAV